MSAPKTYGPLHLDPSAPALPTALAATAVGQGLCENLRRAANYRHAFKLHRRSSGIFYVRQEYQKGYADSRRDPSGDLATALSRPNAPVLADHVCRAFGIPLVAQEPLVGELLIRLFAAAQARGIWIALEYLPWMQDHLRYRLRLRARYDGQLSERDFFIHAPTVEALLLAGLHFFAGGPVAYS